MIFFWKRLAQLTVFFIEKMTKLFGFFWGAGFTDHKHWRRIG